MRRGNYRTRSAALQRGRRCSRPAVRQGCAIDPAAWPFHLPCGASPTRSPSPSPHPGRVLRNHPRAATGLGQTCPAGPGCRRDARVHRYHRHRPRRKGLARARDAIGSTPPHCTGPAATPAAPAAPTTRPTSGNNPSTTAVAFEPGPRNSARPPRKPATRPAVAAPRIAATVTTTRYTQYSTHAKGEQFPECPPRVRFTEYRDRSGLR